MYNDDSSGGSLPQFPPPGPPVPSQQELAPVLVALPPPGPQSRGTVAIRIILAIPHAIILWVLGIVAELILIVGWFAALFTGQLPAFAAEYLTGYLRWQTRVYAYLILLTGVYPPFALEAVPYPVDVAVRPGRLNRLAVLFRFILVIPAGLVLTLVSYGAFTIVMFVTWLIVLITGRMPATLHQALAAVLRYATRVTGYTLLLTSAYPGGLFGDQRATTAYDPAFPSGPGFASPGYGTPASPGYGTPASPDYSAPAEPGYGAPAAAASFTGPAGPWALVLSGAARKLVGWFLVIGVVLIAAMIGLIIIAASNVVSRANALKQLNDAINTVNQAQQSALSKEQACAQNLTCVTKTDTTMGTVYSTFASTVGSIAMPSGAATTDAGAVVAAANKVSTGYTQLGKATTATQYNSLANASNLQGVLNTLGTDVNKLEADLGAVPSG